MDARYTAVLEIGSSKVKGAVARTDSDGAATLVAMHQVSTTGCVRHGRVQNIQEVAAAVDEVLRRLENDPAVAPRKIRRIRVALGGRSVRSVHSEAEARFGEETDITPETIERLKREATFNLPADRQVLAVLPRTYKVDTTKVQKAIGCTCRSIQAKVTVVLADPSNRTNLERVRMTGGADTPDGQPVALERVYIPRQLAIAAMALTPSEQQLGCVLVDMGAETTTVSIHREGALQSLVTLPMGGRNITIALAGGLRCTEEQAEYIQVNQASAIADSDASGIDAKEINSYSQARAGEIIANVIHRIETAGFKTADLPAGIILTGGATGMRRMAELFETQTKMKVRTAPADNRVRPGTTGADPITSLEIMALAAWPAGVDGSDLSALPETAPERPAEDEDPYGHDAVEERYQPGYRNPRGYDRRRYDDESDSDDVLNDDPDDDDDYEEERRPKRPKGGKSTKQYVDPDYDNYDEDNGKNKGGRFKGLRRLMTNFGKTVIGTTGPEDMDD